MARQEEAPKLSQNNDFEIIKLLLAAGAHVDVINAAGVSPLYYANKYENMSDLIQVPS